MTVMQGFIVPAAVRIGAIFLMLVTLQDAYTGYYLHQGGVLYEAKQWEKAAGFLGRLSAERAKADPLFLDLWAQTQLQIARDEKNPERMYRAYEGFEKLKTKQPLLGRARLNSGAVLAEYYGMKRQAIPPAKLEVIRQDLSAAEKLEPGSAWVACQAGQELLQSAGTNEPAVRTQGIALIQKCIRIHFSNPEYPYLDPGSRYLNAALSALWRATKDIEQIIKLTPPNRASYKILLGFLMSEGLWESYERVYGQYLLWVREDYETYCRLGEDYLMKDEYRKSFESFRKAFWIQDWSYVRAKAGILAAQQGLKVRDVWVHPAFADTNKIIHDILETADEDVADLIPRLYRIADQSKDPYPQGLFDYRMKRYESAARLLEKSGDNNPRKRYYLASAYWESGAKDKAIAALSPVLEEKTPDLRDLELLSSWDPVNRDRIHQLQLSQRTVAVQSSGWWQQPVSPSDEKTGQRWIHGLNLRGGRTEARLLTHPQGENAVLVVSINNKPAGAFYLKAGRPRLIEFSWESTGGKAWLSADLMKGKGLKSHIQAASELFKSGKIS
ncbi:MAG: hypothetical protein A2Z83_01325 [Omnitrophica bacterium GWA2_52_8]|nr:MAG: hypothetical protein A2Z83_01325 [Omnitrophica bacterium GWA2_52_8]